jgi:hypothetical protein
LSSLSLVDISSKRVSSGAGGSEAEAQSGDKKVRDKAAHKNKERTRFDHKKQFVFMIHIGSFVEIKDAGVTRRLEPRKLATLA